jgi:hypothetical protein
MQKSNNLLTQQFLKHSVTITKLKKKAIGNTPIYYGRKISMKTEYWHLRKKEKYYLNKELKELDLP